jgi:hypothetical protein
MDLLISIASFVIALLIFVPMIKWSSDFRKELKRQDEEIERYFPIWLASKPPHEREHIKHIMKIYGDDIAIKEWLINNYVSSGPSAPYGSDAQNKSNRAYGSDASDYWRH